ncbi:tetratricopeptide repeat-containing protein [Besnoitia besnoiti]|uniref:Tetratricopeptide repeat-containing protein n=1 Tax=Besnoitia besnoiti TaxID=94643 RepID=A0A2A9ML50_BESBE|nr:tetratricopeptide repeat-containing protein [Besnoitia besnoiti]PFH36413.1 tetratricopeptide repeat-containing protein [Besnoitia besnoiti]
MAELSSDAHVREVLFFLAQRQQFRRIQRLCMRELTVRFSAELLFWHSFALAEEGSVAEAEQKLQSLLTKKKVAFAAASALHHYRARKRFAGTSEVDSEETRTKALEEKASANDAAILLAIRFFLLVGELETASSLLTAQEKLRETIYYYPWFWPASIYKSELLMMLGRWEEATECARRVLQVEEDDLDSHKVVALQTVAYKGDIDHGILKIREFFQLLAVHTRGRFSPHHSLLLSRLKIRRGVKLSAGEHETMASLQEAMLSVDEAVSATVLDFRSTLGTGFFIAFRADLLFDAATRYMDLAWFATQLNAFRPPSGTCTVTLGAGFLTAATPTKETGFVQIALSKALSVLTTLCHFMPVHGLAQLTGQPAEGLEQLEKALSLDTALKDSFPYHFVKAELHMQKEDYALAVSTLEDAEKLASVAREQTPHPHVEGQAPSQEATAKSGGLSRLSRRPYRYLLFPVTALERTECLCLMATAAAKCNRLEEAAEILSRAASELDGDPLADRIVLCQASLSANSGDLASAERLLRSVDETSPFYVKAQLSLAHRFLKEDRNRDAYARCFRDIAEVQPTADNFVAHGEALLEVYEPRGAVEAFERAVRARPEDGRLVRRVVDALVKTHQYERAIAYARDALRDHPDDLELRRDLVSLLFRLKRWQEAIDTASPLEGDGITHEGNSALQTKIQVLLLKVKALLAQTSSCSDCEKQTELEERALRTLHRCRAAVKRHLESHPQSAGFTSGDSPSISQLGADVYCQLGAIMERSRREATQVAQRFQEALELDSSRTAALLALSRIHSRQGNLEAAEEYLSALHLLDPANEEASLIKSEIVAAALSDFSKHRPCDLVSHCLSLLSLSPPHFKALGDALALMRKQGLLIESYHSLLTALEDLRQRADGPYIEAGANYCLGIIKRWRRFPQEALQHLDSAKRHPSFYHDCMRHMVEISLDPGECITIETLCGRPTYSLRSHSTASLDGFSEAERLLREWTATGPPLELKPRLVTWQIEALAFSKETRKLDLALKTVGELLLQRCDDVPLLLAAAETLLVMRQISKARVHLKRICELAKQGVDRAIEPETERACLLLAELYIQGGKISSAVPLIALVTNANKECARAWELLGICNERRGHYEQAAHNFEKAWALVNKRNVTVGYRLAGSLLKAKLPVKAISACLEVLKQKPDFAKIRKDVLEKARRELRT